MLKRQSDTVSALIDTLVTRRHELGLTQLKLAEMCGIPQSSIARIESGNGTPNLNTLLMICDSLGLRIVAVAKD